MLRLLLFAVVLAPDDTWGLEVPTDHGSGYCHKLVSYNESHYVPYIETYHERHLGIFYKRRERWNYKKEYVTFFKTVRECCRGYTRTASDTCVPTCSSPCVNGECTAPETCSCHPGYYLNDTMTTGEPAYVCVPICHEDCLWGECVRPFTCMCDYGYQKKGDSSNVCEPICENACVNGKCTEPNTCTCYDGYGYSREYLLYGNETMKHVCVPYCSECGEFQHCSGPEECSCDDGYEQVGDSCKPVCPHGCTNGHCVSPGTCACYDGYDHLENDTTRCEPQCTPPCTNGKCIEPNVCKCDVGYEMNGPFRICEPVCPFGCGDGGHCVSPNVCECEHGYAHVSNETSRCEPRCEVPCVHGTCVAPNECRCYKGYESPDGLTHSCVPTCGVPCGNGTCDAPDHCDCNVGYLPTPGNPVVCAPNCSDGCPFGTCVAPNECSCNKGYKKTESGCVPDCKQPCGDNGVCVAPDICRCKDGYRYVENPAEFTCEPVCPFDCANGTCHAPQLCTCDHGFVKDLDGRCVPFCVSCVNGSCTATGVCECADGHKLVVRSEASQVCEPDCGNCTYGRCIAPGDCRCDVGFVRKDNETGCVSACEDNCNERGLCVTENATCECFYGWNGPRCDQPSFCVVHARPDDQHLNATVIADTVNDTIASVFASSPLCYNNCSNEIGSETLCSKGYRPDGANNDSVACLMSTDSSCYTISEQQTKTTSYATMGGILIIAIIAATVATVAVLLVIKRKARRYSIGDIPAVSARSRTSLLPEEDNNL